MEQLVCIPAGAGNGEYYQGKGSPSARVSSVSLDVQPVCPELWWHGRGNKPWENLTWLVGAGQGGVEGFKKLMGYFSLGGI